MSKRSTKTKNAKAQPKDGVDDESPPRIIRWRPEGETQWRTDEGIEPDMGDQVAAILQARRNEEKAAKPPDPWDEIPAEPEALYLWRQIGIRRDALVAEIEGCERFRSKQPWSIGYRGTGPIAIPRREDEAPGRFDPDVEVTVKIDPDDPDYAHSRQYFARVIESARDRLAKLDASLTVQTDQVERTKRGTTIKILETILQEAEGLTEKEAESACREWLDDQGDAMKTDFAQRALASLAWPEAPTIDLPLLETKARELRNMAGGTGTRTARNMVRIALGKV